jgi:hypothetical protein
VRPSTEQTADWLKKLNHAELPFEIFSERNPLMQQVAQLAEQVRGSASRCPPTTRCCSGRP